MKKQTHFPRGWDEARVQRLLKHYEGQTDEEAVAEDRAAFERATHTTMKVPSRVRSRDPEAAREASGA